MTMTPDRFQQLLDQETADAPPAPLVSSDLAAGRTRLRRRRVVFATALAAVVVVGAAVGVVVRPGGDDRSVDPVAPTVPPGPAQAEVDRVLAECQDRMPEALLRGPVHVMSTASSAYAVQAVFATEEGRYWADCSAPLLLEGATPEVAAYDAEVSAGSGFGFMAGAACAEYDGCRVFGIAFSDRRDPVVAAVRVELSDGSSETVQAPDGYFAVSAVGVLPDGASYDDQADVPGMGSLIRQVTFLDASGAPIAASVFDGTGSSQFGTEVAGLPGLDRYPSLMGAL